MAQLIRCSPYGTPCITKSGHYEARLQCQHSGGGGQRSEVQDHSRQVELDNSLGYIRICCKNKINNKTTKDQKSVAFFPFSFSLFFVSLSNSQSFLLSSIVIWITEFSQLFQHVKDNSGVENIPSVGAHLPVQHENPVFTQ